MKLDISEEELKKQEEAAKAAAKTDESGKTKLGIDVKKEVDLAEWYK